MSLETPEKIRSLQRKLYCKAKAEPAYRFYMLYDKIYRIDILAHAYALCRENDGAPGVDGVRFATIEAQSVEGRLSRRPGARDALQGGPSLEPSRGSWALDGARSHVPGAALWSRRRAQKRAPRYRPVLSVFKALRGIVRATVPAKPWGALGNDGRSSTPRRGR
ncbi:hypothetical protein DFR50_12459 [Roseiarcus fermentans]|uniref:Reverse transcriptase (RNA-dependent DNA polymerase) n=1 Tax=Roseiarcus fermentans TaxID=1473586 RepID=A0A366F1X4_9HYPH|nr:hypothetical protein DFR50_12459 [Roseiarcus fermentans]